MSCFEENTFTLAETVYPRSFLHVKEKLDMLAEPSYWSRTPGNVFMGMCHTFQYPEPTMQVTCVEFDRSLLDIISFTWS